MIQFNVEEFRADFAKALSTRPVVEQIVEAVDQRGYDNLVFIGVGGTEIEWRSVLDTLRSKTNCPIYLENAAEFCIKASIPYLTSRSLVITSSVSGDTKEIVAAANLCKNRGIELLGFTKHPETPLGKLLTYFIPMDSPNCDTMFVQYFMLVLALLEKRGDYDGYSRWIAQMENAADGLIAIREKFDATADKLARKYHKAPYSIWTGSGAMWSSVYLFAMCLLEEMQWVRTRPVTSADFFHGTLELVEDGVPVFCVKGVGESRVLDQRVQDFCEKYQVTDSFVVIDMADFSLPGVSDEFREITSILAFSAAVCDRLSKQYEHYTGHSLAFRRYYRQLEY